MNAIVWSKHGSMIYAEDNWMWVWFCDDHDEQENQTGPIL